MSKIANRQSLVFSERGQLSQAIPQVHVERMLHESTPIARFESQHNKRGVYEDNFLCFGGGYDRQRTLVIPIAALTLASDSAITIARFRPSKVQPLWNDSGAIFQWNDSGFGLKVRVTVQKSESQPKSQSYSRMDPQNLNQIAPNKCLNGLCQKHPDVYKIVLSIKLLPPPKKVTTLRIFYRFVQFFLILGTFADRNFMDTQTFWYW